MKTVLITGAARGIGAAAAEKFAEAGYQVVINYLHSAEKAEALAARWPGRALAVQADVADPAQVEVLHEHFSYNQLYHSKMYLLILPIV